MNPNKINDTSENNFTHKKNLFSKIKEIATKTKSMIHRHIMTRIWPKPKENHKGPKF